jgi:hypothetical protein
VRWKRLFYFPHIEITYRSVHRKGLSENSKWTEVMERSANSTPQFAVCIGDSEYPSSLELHKIYRVMPDEDAEQDGDLRMIDESGEDYLYPAGYFMMLELPSEVQRVLLEPSS